MGIAEVLPDGIQEIVCDLWRESTTYSVFLWKYRDTFDVHEGRRVKYAKNLILKMPVPVKVLWHRPLIQAYRARSHVT